MHLYMEVADASGAFGTYDQWLQVQKTSVRSYYTEILKKPGCEKGSRNPESMAENIEKHLEESVSFTIDELERLMRKYDYDDLIFSMLITSIIGKLEGVAAQSSNKIYIPEKLRIHMFYLCHILLLEAHSELTDRHVDDLAMIQEGLQNHSEHIHMMTEGLMDHTHNIRELKVQAPAAPIDELMHEINAIKSRVESWDRNVLQSQQPRECSARDLSTIMESRTR